MKQGFFIIPESQVQYTSAWLNAIFNSTGCGNFDIPISATGNDPATHYGNAFWIGDSEVESSVDSAIEALPESNVPDMKWFIKEFECWQNPEEVLITESNVAAALTGNTYTFDDSCVAAGLAHIIPPFEP